MQCNMVGYNRNLTLVYMTVRAVNSLLKVRAPSLIIIPASH